MSFLLSSPLLRHLWRDKVLLACTVLLSVCALLPLAQALFLPLTDLPYHVALSSQALRLWEGDPIAAHFFEFQPKLSPYWLGYLLLIGGMKVVGPFYAAHLVVGLVVVLLPLSVMRLLIAIGRSPRIGLWAFGLGWDVSMSMGFVSYVLGAVLALVYVAWAIESLRGRRFVSRTKLVVMFLLGAALPLSHAQAAGLGAALIFAVALGELPRFRRFLRLALWSFLPLVALVPWFVGGSETETPPFPTGTIPVYWAPTGERLERFLHYSLGFTTGKVASQIQGMAVLVLLFVPLLLGLTQRGSPRVRRRALSLYGGAWGLYLLLPATLYWPFFQLFIYERNSTYLLAFGLLLPARKFLGRGALWLLPGLVTCLAFLGLVTWHFRTYDEGTRPLAEIIEAIPRGKKVLPVLYTVESPESVHDTLMATGGYVLAGGAGYVAHVFDTPNLPVRPVAAHQLPHPVWKTPRATRLDDHVRHFDYLLIQGKDADRFRPGTFSVGQEERLELKKVKEAGIWRLYSVTVTRAAATPTPPTTPTHPATPGTPAPAPAPAPSVGR